MKKFLPVLFLLLCSPAFATWAVVQHTVTPLFSTCSNTSTSCVITVTSTGTGHVGVIGFQTKASGVPATTITGVNDGVGGVYTMGSTAGCNGFQSGGAISTDCAWTLATVAGATSITVFRSTATGSGHWLLSYTELSYTNGPPTLDVAGNSKSSVSQLAQPGVTLSLSGVNDAIYQIISAGSGSSSVTLPYATYYDGVLQYGAATAINTSSGMAPTWTSTSVGVSEASAVAFKEAAIPGVTSSGLVATGAIAAKGGLKTAGPAPLVTISSTSPLPNCPQSSPFLFNFNALGGTPPYTWSLFSGSLQPGLSLSSGGVLSGSCTNASGTVTFVVQVCDSASNCNTGTFSQTAQATVSPLAVCYSGSSPVCSNPPTPVATNTFYGYTFNAFGGVPPYTWAVTSGGIPTGLALASSGAMAGFPNSAGTFPFTVTVTDSASTTASQAFSIVTIGSNGAPQTALEPQSWVTAHQGGVNSSTGASCQQSDTNCTWNLPKTCNAANHCIHEQLGFGSDDHPATLAGLYAAGCDWTGALGADSAQGWYMWVEMQNAVIADSHFTQAQTALYLALYNSPVKIAGINSPSYNNTKCATAATNTPIGPFTLAGTLTGSLILGETFKQQVTNAEATVLYVTCTNTGSTALPNCADAGDGQVAPISLSQIVGTGDSNVSHLWIGQTSLASLASSTGPVANGYFRLTGQCSAGSGSGSPLTLGYPIGTNDTPCNNLADQIPCFHSALDSAIVANPNCSNDLPNMFTIEATALSASHSVIIEQDGNNTSLSGFEATFWQGQNQSMGNLLTCATTCPYPVFPQTGLSPEIIVANCGSCGRDHYWVHGWDPGDPSLHAGDPSQLSIASGTCGTLTPCYPVTPATSPAQYNCPGWAFYTTNPPSSSNAPVDLTSYNYANGANPSVNLSQYRNGCGDDIIWAVALSDGGNGWDEYFTVNKIHKYSAESHVFQVSNGATNINGNGAGINGPHKFAHFYGSGTAESGIFIGGTPVNPVSNVAVDEEIRDFRIAPDPGYRYLTGNSGHSPASSGGYGCGRGTSSTAPQGCPFNWGMKKDFELKWCLRCMLDGFLLENMWPDGQTGEIATADVRVCSGGDDCGIFNADGTPMTVTNDIRITDGIIRNASGGFTVSPRAGGPGEGGGVSGGMNRTLMRSLLFYNLDQNEFGGSKGGEALIYGAAGNKFINCNGTRALVGGQWTDTVTCPALSVAPNPLSEIDLGSLAGKSYTATGTAYVNFNGQREDPLNGGFSTFSCGNGFDNCLCTSSIASTAGTVSTSGVAVTSTGGTNFANLHYGLPIIINSVTYHIAAVTSSTSLTLTSSAGTQGSVSYSVTNACTAPASGISFQEMIDTGYDCTTLPCVANNTGTWKPLCASGVGGQAISIGPGCGNICGVGGGSACPNFGCDSGACTHGLDLTSPAIQVCVGEGQPLPGCGMPNVTFQTAAFSILDISPGDMVFVTQCTTATGSGSFNAPYGGLPSAIQNIYATSAQVVNSLSVIYPSPDPIGTGAATATGCQVNNSGGWQKNYIVDHIAFYTGGHGQIDGTEFGFYTQMQNNQMTNNAFYFGGLGKGITCVSGTGCAGNEANTQPNGAYRTWDALTNQIHHNVFILPTAARAALYSAVGQVGSVMCAGPLPTTYPATGNCTEYLAGSTLTAMTVGCSTSQTTDANGVPLCLGLTGFLSGTASFPSTDCTSATLSACPLISAPWGTFDYHSLALCTSCHSAGLNVFTTMGSDTLQIGPCIAGSGGHCTNGTSSMESIDDALVRSIYVCTGSCGTGPWPD